MSMIKYPNFDGIITECKNQIEAKFAKYGNSWIGKIDDNFWENRAEGEWIEVILTTNRKDKKREIRDLINVLSMWHDNIET